MYTEHFGFQEDPFGVSPDPRFLYLGPAHHEAFAALLYGIKMRRGFMCLIGEPGTGKTTLLYALLEQVDGNLKTVFLPGTDLTFKQRLQFIIESLGAKPLGGTVLSLTRQLQELLADQWRIGSNVVLIFDEAQNLTVREMEDIRLLTNFEVPQTKLLQVILVGQPQLRDKLALPELAQLKQRITVNVNLRPLTLSETSEYIEYRLRCTNWHKPLHTLFSRPVVATIYQLSGGIPRLINAICHNALLIAYAENKTQVQMEMVQEAAQELDLTEAAKPTFKVRPPAGERVTVGEHVPPGSLIPPKVMPVASAIEPEPEVGPQVGALTPEPAVAVEELGQEDLALGSSPETALTLAVGEPTEPELNMEQEEVVFEPITPAPTLATTPVSESDQWPEPVAAVSHPEFVSEVHGAVGFELGSDQELEPALDLEQDLTFLPEESETAEFWPEEREETEPAVDLGQDLEFTSNPNVKMTAWNSSSEDDQLEPASNPNAEVGLWSEATLALDSLVEPGLAGHFESQPNGIFTSALSRTDSGLFPPKPKVNGESGTARRIASPRAPRRIYDKLTPRVGYELEPDIAAAGTPVPSSRRWWPAHPTGLSLDQLLDELERFAQVRESMSTIHTVPAHEVASFMPMPQRQPQPPAMSDILEKSFTPELDTQPEPRPVAEDDISPVVFSRSEPTSESFVQASTESKPNPFASVTGRGPQITGQHVRHSIQRPRLSLAHLIAVNVFIAMLALLVGLMGGVALKTYFPEIVQYLKSHSSAVVPQPALPAADRGSLAAAATSRIDKPSPQSLKAINPQPLVPPAPVMQPETSLSPGAGPTLLGASPLEGLELRTVTIRPGDDLSRLLRREYGYVNARLVRLVQAANPQIADWSYLTVGQQLNLPLDPEGAAAARQ